MRNCCLCNGKDIQPIDRLKFQIEVPEGYAAKQEAVAFAGNYEYLPDAFDQSSCRQLELKIFSEGNASPNAKVIPAKTVQQVWADFEGYREAIKGQ